MTTVAAFKTHIKEKYRVLLLLLLRFVSLDAAAVAAAVSSAADVVLALKRISVSEALKALGRKDVFTSVPTGFGRTLFEQNHRVNIAASHRSSRNVRGCCSLRHGQG